MLQIHQDESGDFCCPKCSTRYRVTNWDPENGDPLMGPSAGEFIVWCRRRECTVDFAIEVKVKAEVTATGLYW